MKTSIPVLKKTLILATGILLLPIALLIQSCQKEPATDLTTAQNESTLKRKPHNPPPPPPPQFYFTNCGSPVITGSFKAGVPANATLTLNYVNSPGGPYAAVTTTAQNGITLTAPAGTLNTGSGSVVFTASGTPVNTGFYWTPFSINGSISCSILITVTYAPVSGPTADPGPASGSTGIVNFVYKGQSVAYKTVRANDGNIWLQQNLGSPQVAFYEADRASFGDYFQWGRWDDGHQAPNSSALTGSTSLMNPSHIPSGNPNFIKGIAGTMWWSVGGVATDTWSGTTATAVNGKDPCAVIGPGWRLPSSAEWQAISIQEDLFGTLAAYQSNLMLPSAGNRYSLDGGLTQPNGDIGYYWTSTGLANSKASVLFFDNVYNAGVVAADRAEGFNCRCIKN